MGAETHSCDGGWRGPGWRAPWPDRLGLQLHTPDSEVRGTQLYWGRGALSARNMKTKLLHVRRPGGPCPHRCGPTPRPRPAPAGTGAGGGAPAARPRPLFLRQSNVAARLEAGPAPDMRLSPEPGGPSAAVGSRVQTNTALSAFKKLGKTVWDPAASTPGTPPVLMTSRGHGPALEGRAHARGPTAVHGVRRERRELGRCQGPTASFTNAAFILKLN